jgi:hypothetical protein
MITKSIALGLIPIGEDCEPQAVSHSWATAYTYCARELGAQQHLARSANRMV